ncbi:MAG: glycerol-3-phosphate acyltransferase PlsY [Motiliproteus sp.]|jgi:glycerol-3-phosphate acyltransferase PlsY
MTIDFSSPALLLLLAAYLLGSVSSAVLVCHALGLNDPRSLGSKNPGATNVWRTGSHRAGVITLAADLFKGALPVWLAQRLELDLSNMALCGLSAMLGHLYPLYFKFRGGKGVATLIGACLVLQPLLVLCQIGLWLLLAGLLRRSSPASLVMTLATPLLYWWLPPSDPPALSLAILTLMSLLVILRHRTNIHKLLQGEESRL